ncbi:MAG: CBS domain-containing protein [Acetobacteraceae bacterium]
MTGCGLGGIFERDFVNATARYGAEAVSFPVERLMSKRVITCRPNDRIEDALAAMTMARIRHLPVVADNRLVGIVSIGDLVKHRLDEKVPRRMCCWTSLGCTPGGDSRDWIREEAADEGWHRGGSCC